MPFQLSVNSVHLAYYTACVHLVCIQSLSLSLSFPFTPTLAHWAESERKWQLNFLPVVVCGIGKKCRATVLASISSRH